MPDNDTKMEKLLAYVNADRYKYLEREIASEPEEEENYIEMIKFLTKYLCKEQDDEADVEMLRTGICSRIIYFDNQLKEKFYKGKRDVGKARACEYRNVLMYILEGELAEATEILLKRNSFYIEDWFSAGSENHGAKYRTQFLPAMCLYAAYRQIGFEQGCDEILSKMHDDSILIEDEDEGEIRGYCPDIEKIPFWFEGRYGEIGLQNFSEEGSLKEELYTHFLTSYLTDLVKEDFELQTLYVIFRNNRLDDLIVLYDTNHYVLQKPILQTCDDLFGINAAYLVNNYYSKDRDQQIAEIRQVFRNHDIDIDNQDKTAAERVRNEVIDRLCENYVNDRKKVILEHAKIGKGWAKEAVRFSEGGKPLKSSRTM